MARSSGSLPGRGVQKGDPFFGALLGLAAKPLAKLGGKLVAKVGGKVLRKGQTAGALTRAAKAAGGFGTAVGAGIVGTKLAGRIGGAAGMGRRYRRMNAGNAKALRRAIRRMESFGKLAMKCGYVRRKPAGWASRAKAKKVC